MLYKLHGSDDRLESLESLPFLEVSDLGRREKDLENLIADHLLDVLFEDAALQPIFQERSLQAEADIYALNKSGDLVIFELKRGPAGPDAALQAIRYAQDSGQWPYSELKRRYSLYMQGRDPFSGNLRDAHKDAFQLEASLHYSEFNRRQHLYIVGSAADEKLMSAVDYWKKQGLSVQFFPYRIYQLHDELYFEFFSFPYDRHSNPASAKGVIFDTNRSYDEEAVWEMMEKRRVAAYGGVKHVVEYLNPKDIVFFNHKYVGIIAAAEVLPGPPKHDGEEEEYREVRFLTAVPAKAAGLHAAVSAAEVSQVTGKTFFWARTDKRPYLDPDETQKLLVEVKRVVGDATPRRPMQPTDGAS